MRFLPYLILFFLLSCSDPVSNDDTPLTMDVQVHMLYSPESEALTTTLTEEEITLLVEGINEVWSQGNIEWDIASVAQGEALNGEEYERMLRGESSPHIGMLERVVPIDETSTGVLDVFFIRDLGGLAGGVYFPHLTAVVQPELDPFGNRSLNDSLVRIFAHELGHALSLPHVPCPPEGNLMAPGCTNGDRTLLNSRQVQQARGQATSGAPFRP